MKLSEKRIRTLVRKIAGEMIAKGLVVGSEADVANALAKTIQVDQEREEAIEDEAKALIARQRNLPPPGTGEYQAALAQAKRQIAMKKGFNY